MSTALIRWQAENTKQVNIRFNRNQDRDVIEYLESTGSPSQTIRRLIRDEIARTGWEMSAPETPLVEDVSAPQKQDIIEYPDY